MQWRKWTKGELNVSYYVYVLSFLCCINESDNKFLLSQSINEQYQFQGVQRLVCFIIVYSVVKNQVQAMTNYSFDRMYLIRTNVAKPMLVLRKLIEPCGMERVSVERWTIEWPSPNRWWMLKQLVLIFIRPSSFRLSK